MESELKLDLASFNSDNNVILTLTVQIKVEILTMYFYNNINK